MTNTLPPEMAREATGRRPICRDVVKGFFALAATMGVFAALLQVYLIKWGVADAVKPALPYVVLGVGASLIFVLVVHFVTSRSREREAVALAASLSAINDELNQKVADIERMAVALGESERKYRAVFENIGVGILQMDDEGRVLDGNLASMEMLGYEDHLEMMRELSGANALKLFADDKRRKEWMEGVKVSDLRDFEAKICGKNGRLVWVNMSGHALRRSDGSISYVECALHDVTERSAALEAMKIAKEQADLASRSKSEFLASISHELRTPLNAIIGFSEIIMNQLFGPVGKPQYVEYARDIHDGGELLLSLINDILDMAKVEAGKRQLSESVVNMDRLLQSVVRLMSVRAKSGKLRLTAKVPRDLPFMRGEERALKQVLTNLLANAIKFTPEGGEITMAASVSPAGKMVLQVKDTGVGISAEDIPTALAPFGQIENSLSGKSQGTGLGLPLTKALIELHGGDMRLESVVGKGTSITIEFPSERTIASA